MSYPADPHWANVLHLITGDGANGNTRIPDEKGTRWAANTAILSSLKAKFGNTSIYFSGVSSSKLTGTVAVTSATDATVEFWVYPLIKVVADPVLFSFGFQLFINPSTAPGKVVVRIGGSNLITSTNAISDDQWSHVALTKSGTTYKLYINGQLEGSVTSASTISLSGSVEIGTWGTNLNYFRGYLAHFRYTNNVNRYPAAFTPPTAAFPGSGVVDPYYDKVVLHMHCDGENNTSNFVDQKGHACTTEMGANSSFPKHYVSVSIGYSLGGSCSLLLSGVVQYDHTDFNPGAEDFEIEFFIYGSGTTSLVDLIVLPDAPGTGYGLRLQVSPNNNQATLTVNNAVAFSLVTGVSTNGGRTSLVRSGSTIRLFSDGALKASYNMGSGAISSNNKFRLGSLLSNTIYLDELRYTKGVARNLTNYTPSTAPFPHVGPNFLSGTVLDASSQPLARTVRSFRRADGLLVDTVTSNATTGAFELRATDATEHFVMVFDDAKNAMVYDHIDPMVE